VHNDRVTRSPIRRPHLALVAAAALVLAGCGSGNSSTPTTGSSGPNATAPTTSRTTSSPTSQSTSSASATVVQGVSLTAQGSQLKIGEAAKVSWQPNQKVVGVLRLAVTQVQKVSIDAFRDFRLDSATQSSTPYYVHARVTNLGRTNLSGVPVPLYLLDHRNTLLQSSTFQAQFPACPSRPLPGGFTHGKKTSVCLVYFASQHGTMDAVSFRPTQAFDAITWQGRSPRQKPAKRGPG
jgi:hypothetical protein